MKLKKYVGLLSLIALATGSVYASMEGGHSGNGGDPCEKRIKEIRDNMRTWIEVGNFRSLKFSPTESADTYKVKMLGAMDAAKISCGDETILIGRSEKTCKNFIDETGAARIQCNFDRFDNKMNESEQFMLVHHEYAGLAGFEVTNDEDSDYHLSAQISEKLESVVVKRLPIAPLPDLTPIPEAHYFCKDSYNKKLVRIEDNRFLRETGVNAVATASMLTMFGTVIFGTPVATSLAFGGFPFVLKGAALILDREAGLFSAKGLLEQVQISRESYHQHSYDTYIEVKRNAMNSALAREGLPRTVSREEVIAAVGPKENLWIWSAVDAALQHLNRKRTRHKLSEFSYGQFETLVRAEAMTDSFCKNDHPLTEGQIIRKLDRQSSEN